MRKNSKSISFCSITPWCAALALSLCTSACQLSDVSKPGNSSSNPGSPAIETDGETKPDVNTETAPGPEQEPSTDAKSGASPWPEKIPDGPRDLGLPCEGAKDCKSQICAEVPKRVKGVETTELRCSECTDDVACTSKDPKTYCMHDRKLRAKVCADGSPGDTCQDDGQCKSQLCAKVNLGDNETELKACSTCRTHSDCQDPGKPNCISRPQDSWKPYNQCLEDGVRKNGEVCFPCETGDRECQGLCVAVETPGSFCIGVCGECAIDSDCETGYVCQPPKLTPGKGGLHEASKCVKKGE